jgi:DNA-binding beta-propeller fold protein YncE
MTMKTGFLTRSVRTTFERRWLPKVLLASPFVFAAAFGAPQASAQIAKGTVMASTGNGKVTKFDQNGVNLGQLNTMTGSSELTGSIFDSAANFYVTDFEANTLTKFDHFGVLIGTFGGPYNRDPESITLDSSGNFYVGQADGARTVLKFNSGGILLATFSPATENRGTDWIELAKDQCTLFYTSEGRSIKRFNVCTNTQLTNFNVAPLPSTAFAHRLLPAGGILVADSTAIIRLDAAGNQIKTYIPPGVTNILFALNLDPDGTSFWTADFAGHVFKIDIATGNIVKQWNASAAPGFVDVAGLSVKGEITNITPGGKKPPFCGLRLCR